MLESHIAHCMSLTYCFLAVILPDFRPGFPPKALLALWDAQRRTAQEGKEGI